MVNPLLIATTLASLVLVFVYIYLYIQEREEFIKLWTISWCMYLLRIAIEFFVIYSSAAILLSAIYQLATLFSGLFLLLGAYRFTGKKFNNCWLHVSFLCVFLISVGLLTGQSQFAISLPTMLLTGSMFIWTGWLLSQFDELKGLEIKVIVTTFILLGFHHWDFPFLYPLSWFTNWGYLIGSGLRLLISVALLMLIYQRIKNQLTANEKRFRLVAQAATAAIISVNPEGKIIFWNKSAACLFGYQKEEIIGEALDVLLPEQDFPAYQKILSHVVWQNEAAPDGKKTVEMVGVHKDGRRIPLEISLSAWQQGGVVFLTVIIHDITDRKQAEQALKRYQFLFDNANDNILVVKHGDGKIIDANPTALKTYGYTKQEIIAKSIFELRVESRDVVVGQLKEAQQQGVVFEAMHRRKDGSTLTVEVSSHGVVINGETFLFSIIRDITERKQAEEILKKYQTMFENARDNIIFAQVPGGQILDANRAAVENYGYTREELLAKTLHQLRADNDAATADKHIEQADKKGIRFATMHRRKDGSVFPAEINSRGVTIGRQRNLVVIIRDITKHKLAEEALAREKERLAVTLRSIGEGVITTNIEGRIVLINKVAEKLTGWPQREAIGRPLGQVYRIIDERTREVCPDPVEKVLLMSNSTNSDSHILMARDGAERVITDCGTPITDRNSEMIGVVLVFHDITEERKMREELLKANKLESLGILAGGIAHDFNNILTSIIGNVSLLKAYGKSNSEISQILYEFEQATWRAKGLTQQLLTFAKGGAPIKKSASIKEIVKETADFVLRGAKVSCIYAMPDNLWPVEVDEGQISQVINNLVINAMQAMTKGGTIRISCENVQHFKKPPGILECGDYIKIAIQDQGYGIPRQDYEKLFDPYFTTKPNGTGLGLAISYSIINQHNGLMEVTSEIARGTTFTIYLPASTSQVERKNDAMGFPVPSGKILIMDDEKLVLSVAGKMLKYLGYQVDYAHHGVEAIEKYKAAKENGSPFVAVIMDLTIPGAMGGLETLNHLLHFDPEINAIVSSGYSTDPIMSNYKKYGFKAVVTKPYRIEEMAEALQGVLLDDTKGVTHHAE
ncbi:hybrid sensor histidine kinase/response regulator [Desulfotomaculum sp. 1211_IL3151]|uniref:hybrid sensor histidine kinase/response regulator n=1 Tax=Desulfotomaculum sp. 1211_IL3151 TaxID=3084055 RepID=UPI002FDA8803